MGLGPKSRPYHHPLAFQPAALDRPHAMEEDGQYGGCRARSLWHSDLEEIEEFLSPNSR
jgi:hypothetical protein